MEEMKVYKQLYEAMEALVHICRDGCRTIGPRDQALKGSRAAACKGIELLVRHFSACRVRVPGGCANCKRMWQLLELHSRMCLTPDTCTVPLCRHFKLKMQHLGRKDEIKWNLLACKLLESRGTMSFISERRKFATLKPPGSRDVGLALYGQSETPRVCGGLFRLQSSLTDRNEVPVSPQVKTGKL